MNKDWPEMAKELTGAIRQVRLGAPEVAQHVEGQGLRRRSQRAINARDGRGARLAAAHRGQYGRSRVELPPQRYLLAHSRLSAHMLRAQPKA